MAVRQKNKNRQKRIKRYWIRKCIESHPEYSTEDVARIHDVPVYVVQRIVEEIKSTPKS